MPNMKRHIARHNNKILREAFEQIDPGMRETERCNCKPAYIARCSLPGKCAVKNCIYVCEVTRDDNGHSEFYTGASKNFKRRWYVHNGTIINEDHDNHTTLSTYIWDLKNSVDPPITLTWSIRDRAPPFNPITGFCRLCDLEKFYILTERHAATLNQRSEFFCHCYHKDPQLLVKQ